MFERVECGLCGGTGKCTECHGSGLDATDAVESECVECCGAGRCHECEGAGKRPTWLHDLLGVVLVGQLGRTTSRGSGCGRHRCDDCAFLESHAAAHGSGNRSHNISAPISGQGEPVNRSPPPLILCRPDSWRKIVISPTILPRSPVFRVVGEIAC